MCIYDITLLHKATYMQLVVITYNKERWYSLELSHIIKRDGIVLELSYKIKE